MIPMWWCFVYILAWEYLREHTRGHLQFIAKASDTEGRNVKRYHQLGSIVDEESIWWV